LRVLFLTFYHYPDLSAGSFRATALVKALKEINPLIQLDIMTTLPHRYSSFCAEAPVKEEKDGVKIQRIKLPAHKSGMLDQSLAFCSFARQVRHLVIKNDYDLVIATSSRLMTAVLASWVASNKKIPLYLDIRDIFADTIKDVLPKFSAFFAKPFFSMLEKWAIKRASKVNLVSPGFAEYFETRYPQQKFSYFTNGIDEEFLNSQPKSKPDRNVSSPLRIVYAGNIGEGQGLHEILPGLANRLSEKAGFRIIGDGGRKNLLIKRLESAKVKNVELLPPMTRDQLIEEYKQADVLFLHLNDYEAFKKVLPSKIFEYAVMGKPILAGVPGYSAEFIRAEISNAAVFHPCDELDAIKSLESLSIHDSSRGEFVDKYSRANICRDLAKDILSLT